MSKRDYYAVLEVSKTASLDEIKKAYRKKALQFHPDRNAGDKAAEEKFKEATEAYSVLSEAETRQKYDQFGHAAFEQGRGGFEGFGDFSGFEDIFGDLFGSIFGSSFGGGGRSRGRTGRDLKYDLQISFEEAAFGTEKEIKLHRRVPCNECDGSGAAKGSKAENCQQCGGSGQLRMQQGFFTISRTCHVCSGAGRVIKNPCSLCRGTGQKSQESRLNVKVPPGIDNGQRLKLRGEGEPGQVGGSPGDLYVQVSIQDHPIFQRQESELVCEVPISYSTAVLGAEIDVPSLEGLVKLKIPAGTQSGKVFRLKGKGIQILGTNDRGDEHVQVTVRVPKKVSEKKRLLLQQLKHLEEEEGDPETKGFLDKVKDLFAGG